MVINGGYQVDASVVVPTWFVTVGRTLLRRLGWGSGGGARVGGIDVDSGGRDD